MSAFVLTCPVCGCVRPHRGEHLGDCPRYGEHHLVAVEPSRLHEVAGSFDAEPDFHEP